MTKEYKTFAEQFYLENASIAQRTERDIRLLRWIAQNIITWFRSRKIRAEFRRCRDANQTFYVDRFAGPPGKK